MTSFYYHGPRGVMLPHMKLLFALKNCVFPFWGENVLHLRTLTLYLLLLHRMLFLRLQRLDMDTTALFMMCLNYIMKVSCYN